MLFYILVLKVMSRSCSRVSTIEVGSYQQYRAGGSRAWDLGFRIHGAENGDRDD